MSTTTLEQPFAKDELLATWHRERSTAELKGFIERKLGNKALTQEEIDL